MGFWGNGVLISVFKKYQSIVACVFSVCLSFVVSAKGSPTVDGFDAKFSAALKANKIPGAAYAFIEGNKITKVRVFGTRAQGSKLPVTDETVFRLASVSKTYTAELAAILVAEGKLKWDTKVVDYVPNFRLKTPGHAESLKVSHILSHSTGLTPNSYDIMLEDGWSLEKIVPYFKDLKPLCQPGKCYGYQNIAFSLIQPVIEKSTGGNFESLMREKLFQPLGLTNTSIGLDAYLAAPNRAEPHVLTKSGWHKSRVNGDYYTVSPAAGVNATVVDLAKWVQAQMGNNSTVLNKGLLDTVMSKQVHTKKEVYRKAWKGHLSDAYYGYGWRIYQMGDEDIILHAGGVSGFRSLVSFSKERGVGQVILMNAESRSIEELGANFWTSLLAEKPRTTIAAGR